MSRKTLTTEPIMPRDKRARRRIEYMGGATAFLFVALILLTFFESGLHQYFLRSPNVAAVVSIVLVDLANEDRVQSGLDTLTVSPTLIAVAQAKANDMATKGYFAHTSPEGIDPWHWFKKEGYVFAYAGENLAIDFSDSADVNRAWMDSQSHRNNLLDSHYTEIGIATAQGMYEGRMTTFVVQAFGSRSSGVVQPEAPQKITVASVPNVPTETATAMKSPAVLGSATAPATKKLVVQQPTQVVEESVAESITATNNIKDDRPWWVFAVAFPRATMQYVYYVLGILILLALALDTGLEVRWHHRRHAIRAGALLAMMAVLFFIADAIFFVAPVLAISAI